tara:strand:+ start:939 stop:1133 length:195 start_codon:yes stop_codon:yes gene_type:complete
MILQEHTKDFDSYIETMNNIKMAIGVATEKGDIDTLIQILKQFSIATDCLVGILQATKEEKVSA